MMSALLEMTPSSLPTTQSSKAGTIFLSQQYCSKKKYVQKQLPADFVPSEYSVLCGRGKSCTASPGNRHLKSLVQNFRKPYSEARTKVEKSAIVCRESAIHSRNGSYWFRR